MPEPPETIYTSYKPGDQVRREGKIQINGSKQVSSSTACRFRRLSL
ncbi:MAG: hypothetical protein OEM02_11130 [Desulfobulbaceae bacterium]|nr:hypothetical protein [Desulfobulbaceae bacterium]